MGWILCIVTYFWYAFSHRPELIIASSLFAISGSVSFAISKLTNRK